MHACKHAEPNPPTNLSAMMTCDSQGYKVYIEWKVHKTDSYNQHTALSYVKLMQNFFYRLLFLPHFILR